MSSKTKPTHASDVALVDAAMSRLDEFPDLGATFIRETYEWLTGHSRRVLSPRSRGFVNALLQNPERDFRDKTAPIRKRVARAFGRPATTEKPFDPPAWLKDPSLLPKKPPTKTGRP